MVLLATSEKKGVTEIVQKILFNNPLKSFVSKDHKKCLGFLADKNQGNLFKLNNKTVYNFSLTEIGTKRRSQMDDPIETVNIRG